MLNNIFNVNDQPSCMYPDNSPGGQFPTVQVLVLMCGCIPWQWSQWGVVLVGNSPRDCGPGGQWLGFIFIWWGIVLMGSCPRTLHVECKTPLLSISISSLSHTNLLVQGKLNDRSWFSITRSMLCEINSSSSS